MLTYCKQDDHHFSCWDYELVSRTEPLPSVGVARRTAENYSTRYYGVPDQYGMVAPGIIKPGRNGQMFQ